MSVAPDDIRDAFAWHRGPLLPVRSPNFYDRWEAEQRGRWAAESEAIALEHKRESDGTQRFVLVLAGLLAIAGVCLALFVRAGGGQ